VASIFTSKVPIEQERRAASVLCKEVVASALVCMSNPKFSAGQRFSWGVRGLHGSYGISDT
jgi:hypothetical protein